MSTGDGASAAFACRDHANAFTAPVPGSANCSSEPSPARQPALVNVFLETSGAHMLTYGLWLLSQGSARVQLQGRPCGLQSLK